MSNINLSIGSSDFAKIRTNKYYYIDKSMLISTLLNQTRTEVRLITRPRRFGKTLALNMLAEFFDISRNNAALFEGLQISDDKALCGEWMNQYPVIFLSFKDINGLDFSGAYGQFVFTISELYKKYTFLMDSALVDEDDKEIFRRLKAGSGSDAEVKRSLNILVKMLQQHYSKKVIFLLDEYDVPLAKASNNGYYEEMLDVIRMVMSTTLKDNSSLCFAVITGCLRIAKESIFTGINNLVVDTISDDRFSEYFGFTGEEVQQLLSDARLTEAAEKIRIWYDGYQFGNTDIYCPWDVLNYISDLQINSQAEPKSYWENTSDNSIIEMFLAQTNYNINEKFEILLEGGHIREHIVDNLTYDMIESSEDNLWSLLYLTGYLTKAQNTLRAKERISSDTVALKIPNAEIMDVFRNSVKKWFYHCSANSDRRELFDALWNADVVRMTEIISDALFVTISYHENFYHAFLVGLYSNAGYIVESNYEQGLGRADIVIKDPKKRKAAIIEVKIVKSVDKMDSMCNDALQQIINKQYAKGVAEAGYKTIHCFGISFHKKECLVKRL